MLYKFFNAAYRKLQRLSANFLGDRLCVWVRTVSHAYEQETGPVDVKQPRKYLLRIQAYLASSLEAASLRVSFWLLLGALLSHQGLSCCGLGLTKLNLAKVSL